MATAPLAEELPLVAEHPGEEAAGRPLRYQLVRRLGEGGFGWVWLARQEHPVRRDVAVKILKPSRRMDAARSRFAVESRVLARLKHPGIAVLHETGVTTAGSHCLVMEWVDGLPITEHCDAQRLGIRERVQLVASVADAVSHAHQMLVMHRDLKPSNILVPRVSSAGGSMPKVIDFGVAKLLDAEAFDRTCWTFTGEVLGTYDYMSPEQAEADPAAITVTADVYSLGAVLYELLLGAPPQALARLHSKERVHTQRLPQRDDPVTSPLESLRMMADERRQSMAASCNCGVDGLQQALSSDLGAVLMKACAPDPVARYSSMAAFAADLRAWLEQRPVTALPPSMVYVLGKYARRHRVAVASAALAAAGLVGAGMVILQYAEKARAAEKTAVAQKNKAEEAARAAKEALGEAEASSKLLLNALNSPFPTQKGRDVTVLQVLDQAVSELRADTTLSFARRASLLHTLGSTFYAHSRYAAAADALDESVRLRRLMHGMAHTSTLWESLLLARCWIHTGMRPQALEMAESCLAVIPKLNHPDAAKLEIAARDLKISCLYYLKQHEKAARFARECVAVSQKLHGDEAPETLRFQDELAANLAYTGSPQEAADILEAILPKIRAKFDLNDSKASIVACRLAALRLDQGLPEKALPLTEEAVTFARRVYPASHGQTAFFTRTQVRALLDLGQKEQAMSVVEQWLGAIAIDALKKDERELLSREAFQMQAVLPDEFPFQPLRSKLAAMTRTSALQPSATAEARPVVEAGSMASADVDLQLDLRTALMAGIGPGHVEAEVRSGLPSMQWQRTEAELPGCYKLRSPDFRGVEFTFRQDGVLVRTRLDLTQRRALLTQDLGEDPQKAMEHLGQKYHEEVDPKIQQLLTYHSRGLEWRLKKDLKAGRLAIISTTAPYWKVSKP